jgi:hypothetical protein
MARTKLNLLWTDSLCVFPANARLHGRRGVSQLSAEHAWDHSNQDLPIYMRNLKEISGRTEYHTFSKQHIIQDRFCDPVIRVASYMCRGTVFVSRPYQIFWEVVGLERCVTPCSFVGAFKRFGDTYSLVIYGITYPKIVPKSISLINKLRALFLQIHASFAASLHKLSRGGRPCLAYAWGISTKFYRSGRYVPELSLVPPHSFNSLFSFLPFSYNLHFPAHLPQD